MNNFEKRKFLSYLETLLPVTNINCYNFDDVFDFFCLEFKIDKTQYPLDKCNDLDLDNSKKQTKFKKIFRKDIQEAKKALTPKSTLLERQLLILKDVYSLSHEEYEIVTYLVLDEINNAFHTYFDCLTNNSLNTFARNYLKIRSGKKERILENLYLKNITNDISSDCINQNLLQIFDNSNCNTCEKIMNLIIGKPEKSKLTIKDYTHLEKEMNKVTKILSCSVQQKKQGVNILLYGDVGSGKSEGAKLIANMAKIPIYSVTDKIDGYKEAQRTVRLADLYSKQHLLARSDGACLLFDEAEDVMNRGFSSLGNSSKGYLNSILDSTAIPVIWTTNDIYGVDPAFLRRMNYCIEFKKLSDEKRLNIWKRVLKKNNFRINEDKIRELNQNYEVPASVISNAVQTTKMIGGDENDFEEMIENVAKVVTKKENVKKTPELNLGNYDISLVNTDLDMKDLTEKIKQSGKLNFSLCLYGHPGSGKSKYAKYLAEIIGTEVLLKRASDLISPYVGETEQNIAAAFAEAKSKKAMLIFDEADTFLQDRSGATHSWEIAQVNEMLTQMESAETPFVCTTNLLDSLDEASLRRFTFKIKFDFMTKNQVNSAMEHFFGLKNTKVDIKGLTAGDFATVKKKAEFLNINNAEELIKMLDDEVRIKKTPELHQTTIGF